MHNRPDDETRRTPPHRDVKSSPGGASGKEQQAEDRRVPGTASAAEGYQKDRGTLAGSPLEGVEAVPQDDAAPKDEDARPGRSAGDDAPSP